MSTKKRRLNSFNDDWLLQDEFKDWITKGRDASNNVDDKYGYCSWCKSNIYIRGEGVTAWRDHGSRQKHIRNRIGVVSHQKINQ